MTVRYLDRDEWGGGPVRKGVLLPRDNFVGLVVHHTVMVQRDYDHDAATLGDIDDIKHYMRMLQTARPDLGLEVPYSFCVFKGATPDDCVVAEGRGLGVTGAHTTGYNSTRYGVAYAGNAEVDSITDGVLEGYRWVGQRLTVDQPVATIGHRDTKSTACPGENLYARLDEIQPPFTTEEDDMPLNADDLAKVEKIVRKVLDEGTGKGQKTWAGTSKATLDNVQKANLKLDKLVADGG